MAAWHNLIHSFFRIYNTTSLHMHPFLRIVTICLCTAASTMCLAQRRPTTTTTTTQQADSLRNQPPSADTMRARVGIQPLPQLPSAIPTPSAADVWTVERAIQHAMDNNISIRQSDIDARLAKLTNTQANLSQLPNVNAAGAYGNSAGRSINPVSNDFVETNYTFLTLSGNADVLLFGWFQRRNTISQSKYNLQAAQADLDQMRDDVALNVATGYLRIVLAQGQVKVNERQVDLSRAQLYETQQFVIAGILPDLNVAQLQAQLAVDSTKLMTSIATYQGAILDMRALINLPFSTPFAVVAPQVNLGEQANLASLSSEDMYAAAMQNLGLYRSADLRVNAAKKGYDAAKGALLPQLGLAAQLGTNYTNIPNSLVLTGTTNTQVEGSYVDVNGNQYPIYQNVPVYSSAVTGTGDQLGNNFRSNIAITLTVPIFNAWRSFYYMKQNQLGLQSAQLNKTQTELNLQRDVYKAYTDATNASQRYAAAMRASEAANRAFSYIKDRYTLGLANTVEYLVVQNTLYTADYELLSAKYDLLLRLKVIDYFYGRDIKL